MVSLPAIREILQSYNLDAPDLLCEQIRSYIALLLRWNKRISLTSVEDPAEIVRYHFAESFLAVKACESLDGRLADVGPGAGFPGIALKMYNQSLEVSLIESNSKKCAFLSEVIRALELESIIVLRSRYQGIPEPEGAFDFVSARALGEISSFLGWAVGAIPLKGRVMLWLGAQGVDEALESKIWRWNPPFAIPRTKGRFILVGSPRKTI
jgi:16S rRNA (guanine527-N7)-methyltransferase